MSIRQTSEYICDLCGDHVSPPDVAVYSVMPGIGQWPIPKNAYISLFNLNGMSIHLCGHCSIPVTAALQTRIRELKEKGKLVGYPRP